MTKIEIKTELIEKLQKHGDVNQTANNAIIYWLDRQIEKKRQNKQYHDCYDAFMWAYRDDFEKCKEDEDWCLRYDEPCDCGSHIRHNNGGNYHDIIIASNTDDKWWKVEFNSTSEYAEPEINYVDTDELILIFGGAIIDEYIEEYQHNDAPWQRQ